MTVKELKEKLNEFSDETNILFETIEDQFEKINIEYEEFEENGLITIWVGEC